VGNKSLIQKPEGNMTQAGRTAKPGPFRVCLSSLVAIGLLSLTAAGEKKEATQVEGKIERKTCSAPDGVEIVYSAAGTGEPALIFIHGGMADRTFWDAQLKAFSDRHRVLALDLAGHGESGLNRKKWGIPEFGADVRAVVETEKAKRVIIFGNSLGGPVAIEAALLLPGRALGVVGVDTFQDFSRITEDEAKQRAEFFRRDFSGGIKGMVRMLFHRDADPAIMADAERRMLRSSPEAAYAMFLSLAGYDIGAAARRLTVPLRTINGDLYPTDLTAGRQVKADFNAIIMSHMGHYPMLERPEEFNKHVASIVAELSK
jgi:pimeloyl-ACP methyl ester carboxylesterase